VDQTRPGEMDASQSPLRYEARGRSVHSSRCSWTPVNHNSARAIFGLWLYSRI